MSKEPLSTTPLWRAWGRTCHRALVTAGLMILAAAFCAGTTRAQELDQEVESSEPAENPEIKDLFDSEGPYPAYRKPLMEDYDIRWGRMTGRIEATISAEYDDNVYLTPSNEHDDFILYPKLTLSLLYPTSPDNALQLDIGAGYRWYLDTPDRSYLQITPQSTIEYRILFREARLQLRLYNRTGVGVDPTRRPEFDSTVTNTSDDGFIFRRFNNLTGLAAKWLATSKLTVNGGYAFGIDQSLSDSYEYLDNYAHQFNVSADYAAAGPLSVGLFSQVGLTDYTENYLNDASRYTVGPQVGVRVSRVLRLTGNVGYTVIDYDQTGSIGDMSTFDGVTFMLGAYHSLGRTTTHGVRGGYQVEIGLESNYTEFYTVAYQLETLIMRGVSLSLAFDYDHILPSLGNAEADVYGFSVGTGYQIARQWYAGLSYRLAIKDAEDPRRNYDNNRVTVEFTRRF